LEEDRLYTIERDNRILLGKMSNIMKAKGSVDNRNSYEYRRYLTLLPIPSCNAIILVISTYLFSASSERGEGKGERGSFKERKTDRGSRELFRT